jgi:hypothetical protein
MVRFVSFRFKQNGTDTAMNRAFTSMQISNGHAIVRCIILGLYLLVSGTSAQTVFTEDFETASLDAIAARWDEARFREHMSLSTDVPPGSPGVQSLMMTSEIGVNTGGHLYKMFREGFDSLYARFYVKFGSTHHPVHHFVHMGGYNPPTRWPQGGAGERPIGDERFTTGMEPHGQRWEWDFYSYWMHMRGNPVPNMYWGNAFHPDPPAPVERGQWTCVEFMMKGNDPVSAFNGEQAFWVDGSKVLHLKQGQPNGYWVWDSFHHHPDSSGFEGFQWRSDPDLRINFFWLLYYMTQGPEGQRDTVWFDDVRISTTYSGTLTDVSPVTPASHEIAADMYPNPFSGVLQLRITHGEERVQQISVHDVLGRCVAVLGDGTVRMHQEVLRWDPLDLPGGVYFIRLHGMEGMNVQRIVYQKTE